MYLIIIMFKEISKYNSKNEVVGSLVGYISQNMFDDKVKEYFVNNSGMKDDSFKDLKNKLGNIEVSLLMNVDVLKDYRKQGIGKMMIQEFLNQSPCSIILIADMDSSDSRNFIIEFYENLGFETITHIKYNPVMILKK